MVNARFRRFRCLLCAASFACALGSPAAAQNANAPPVPDARVFEWKIQPLTETIARVSQDPRPATADGALQLVDWLVFGNIATGAVYDSNVNSTPTHIQGAYGAQIRPSVIALRDTGVQRTLIYGIGDIRYYPSLQTTQVVDTTAGLVHRWEIERDFTYRVQLQGSRGLEASSLVAPIVSTPVKYSKVYGSTAIEKGFDRFFVGLGTSITSTTYDDTRDSLGNVVDQHFRNGNVFTLNGRVGYHLSPIIYTFVEPSLNWRRFQNSALNSSGNQVVAGIGSDRISLFNGELYGGIMNQRFESSAFSTYSGPVYGGRISWYPTRFLTFGVSADQTLATSDFAVNPMLPGGVVKNNTEKFTASWDATRKVTFTAGIDYVQTNYFNTGRKDDTRNLKAGVGYMFTERFGLTLDFTNSHLRSNIMGASYSRDFVSVGGKTRF